MRILKNILFIILVCVLLSLVPVFASENGMNVSITAPSEAEVGDTFTVDFNNDSMTLSSFTCGVQFNREYLEVVSVDVVGIIREWDSSVWNALVSSSAEDALKTGYVGFAFVDSRECGYTEGIFASITFKVLSVGSTELSLYEDSAGEDGVISSDTVAITLEEYTPGSDIVGSVTSYDERYNVTVELMSTGEVISSTFTEEGMFEFKNLSDGTYDIVFTKDSHLKYTLKNIVIKGDDIDLTTCYHVVMIGGDINFDGCVDLKDVIALTSSDTYGKSYEEAVTKTADINGDRRFDLKDLIIITSESNYGKSEVIVEFLE